MSMEKEERMVDNQNAVYIKDLIDTFKKRKDILKDLIVLTKEQAKILTDSPFAVDQFEKTIEKKEQLMQALNRLDDGEDASGGRLEAVIRAEGNMYEQELLEAKELLGNIIDMSTGLQQQETQNQERLAEVLAVQRREIRSFKESSRTAEKYSSNMAHQHQKGQSYFLDKRN